MRQRGNKNVTNMHKIKIKKCVRFNKTYVIINSNFIRGVYYGDRKDI